MKQGMNSYQHRLGLLHGSVALIMLLVSSSGQSTVSYAQFAHAYSQVTQECPNFPTPVTLMSQIYFSENPPGPFFHNSTSTWNPQYVYIKSFQLSGLDVNSTNLAFGILSMKIHTTSEYFYNSSGTIIKSSSTNNTYQLDLYKFNAHITNHQAVITIANARGSLQSNSSQYASLLTSVSMQNVKITISCIAVEAPLIDEEIEIKLTALRSDLDELKNLVNKIGASLEHIWELPQHR